MFVTWDRSHPHLYVFISCKIWAINHSELFADTFLIQYSTEEKIPICPANESTPSDIKWSEAEEK